MSQKVKVDQLAKEIEKTLVDYIGVTEEAAERGVKETGKTALQSLRNAHPAGSGVYGSWDDYNKGWTMMQTKRDKEKHRGVQIHNKDHYQLTHLLEKGHALVSGGRTRAFPHIAPVAEKAEGELLQNIKKQIEKG